jgi:hypothetical protein
MNDTDAKDTRQVAAFERLPAPSHQALKSLHTYWAAKKDARFAPPRSAIRLEELQPLLPMIALAEVAGASQRFHFKLFGTGLVEAYGEDVTGRFSDEIDLDWIGDRIHEEARNVVDERRISVARIRFVKTSDGRYLQYERVLLPLSDDGETVNMLLLGYVMERAY